MIVPENSTFFCSTIATLFRSVVDVVLAHVHAADADAALGGVVKAGDELDERGLAGAGAAENADGHAGGDVQVDVTQGEFLRLGGILERTRRRSRPSRP